MMLLSVNWYLCWVQIEVAEPKEIHEENQLAA